MIARAREFSLRMGNYEAAPVLSAKSRRKVVLQADGSTPKLAAVVAEVESVWLNIRVQELKLRECKIDKSCIYFESM